MSDNLRDRIVAVLNSFPADMRPVAVVNIEKAEAVIRELGLRTQTVAEAEKAFWGISLIHRDETDYRYVTDWKAK